MSKKNPETTFYKDLDKLREKYPMCYIEAWTPEDFVRSLDGEDEEYEDTKLNWNDPNYISISNELYDGFDANYGTNWTRIQLVSKN